MSKRISQHRVAPQSRAFAVVSVVTLLAALFPSTRTTTSARTKQAAATATSSKNAAVIAATSEVLNETSGIRKLAVLQPVRSGAQSRLEIERMIVRSIDEDTTPAEMRAAELALKKLGLAPAEFQFRPFLIKLLTEQVAGYYDPKKQEFYLADWIDLDGQKTVMAHELTHALQDQHFNLRRFERWPKGDSDAELAVHALVEGDATLTMTRYILHEPLERAAALMRSAKKDAGAVEQIDSAPGALRETLLFPYAQGTAWAALVFKQGGWERISRAYTELPQSTEQILHIEKYFAREAPIKVELPDLSQILGADWKRLDYDVNGEWGYYLILNQILRADGESRAAAAGWGGDRYALYEDAKTRGILLAQLSVWDTEENAGEFFNAYAKRTTQRYNRRSNGSSDTNKHSRPATSLLWQTNEGGVRMERRGARIVIVEGIPEKVDVEAMMKTLWKADARNNVAVQP